MLRMVAALFLEKEPPGPIGEGTGWAPVPVWIIIIIIIYYAFIRSIQGYKPIGYRTCRWIVHKEKYSG